MIAQDTIATVKAACDTWRQSYHGSPVLCHGDLHPWNILVEQDRLVGVIDWSDILGCDPAYDFAVHYFWTGDLRVLNAMLASYAPAERLQFTRRIMAAVVCFAGTLLVGDYSQQSIDQDQLFQRCWKWLKDARIRESFA
jgi:streptomycin 6-kinase